MTFYVTFYEYIFDFGFLFLKVECKFYMLQIPVNLFLCFLAKFGVFEFFKMSVFLFQMLFIVIPFEYPGDLKFSFVLRFDVDFLSINPCFLSKNLNTSVEQRNYFELLLPPFFEDLFSINSFLTVTSLQQSLKQSVLLRALAFYSELGLFPLFIFSILRMQIDYEILKIFQYPILIIQGCVKSMHFVYSMMLKHTISILLLAATLCILPSLHKPNVLINPSNQYQLADYTFSFTIQTAISYSAALQIQFPPEFAISDLASANCTLSARVCSFSYASGINAQEYTIVVSGVKNPREGGLSNFQVRTKIGHAIIEESRIFTNAGIRDSVDTFLFIQLSVENNVAGVNSTYSLRFKTRQSYAYTTTLEIGLWNYYNQSSITQVYDNIDNTRSYTLTLPLRNPFSVDTLQDLPAKIYKGTYLLVKGTVKNPIFTAAKLNCQMKYDSWMASNSQYKITDYDFTVTAPYQPIAGSQLQVIVPEYFARYNTGLLGTLYYYGNENNMLSFMGDRVFSMDIVNNAQSLGFRMRLRNPYIIGATSPFRLSIRYQGSLYMFDESTCTTTITNLIPADMIRPLTILSTDTKFGAQTNITLTLPAAPANNQIIVTLPPNFNVSSAATCTLGTGFTVSSCIASGSTITVISSQNLTSVTTLQFKNTITNPLINGTYLVEVLIGGYSYTDLLYVNSVESVFTDVSALGNTLKIEFLSVGIQNGSISVEISTASMYNMPVECSVNGVRTQCYFNTNTNLQLSVLNLTENTAYILIVSGITVTGSTILQLKEYETQNGKIVMKQTITSTISFPAITFIQCGQISANYGIPFSITFDSCLNVINPTHMVFQTDENIVSNTAGLSIDGVSLNSQTYFNKSILVQSFSSTPTIIQLSNIQPVIFKASSKLILSIFNGTVYNYRYNISVSTVNSLPTTLSLSSNSKLDVGVIYNFSITPVATTPVGGIFITFPSSFYSLNESGSWATSNLKNQVSVEQTRVIVNNISLELGKNYYIAVFGVVNPNRTKVTGFTASFVQDGTLDVLAQQTKNLSATIDSTFKLEQLNTSIDFYPQNALMKADYSFTLVAPRAIPARSSLFLTFPKQFSALGSPICSIQQYGFSSCSMISNLSILLVILNPLPVSTPLSILISNITNPFQGLTSSFEFSLTCNSVLIAQSTSLALTISQSCKLNTQLAWSYYPTTVGEESIYEFSYLPSADISFSDQLFVRFPYEFDVKLGRGVSCTYVDGYGKEYETKCAVGKGNREVAMGVGEWTASIGKAVTVKIVGVVNVNLATDKIILGVRQANGKNYRQGAMTLVGVTPTNAASTLIFNQLQVTNAYIRQSASYQINIYTKYSIPCDTMSIYIVFPYYIYELSFGSSLSCASNQFNAVCTITHNNRIKVTPVGTQKIADGLIEISLYGVANPIDQAWISSYYVEIFDELNKIVVGRTYSNLEFYSLSFTSNGPFIKFNNEQDIYMNQGTTIDFNVFVTEPLITEIQARGLGPFSFLPYLIVLPVGTSTQTLSISSPKGQVGDFSIKWSIVGDLSPIYYTPVKRTAVHILSVLTKIWIKPAETPVVVRACSELIGVQLQYSPDVNIVVEVYDSANNLLNSLNFIRGQRVQYFSICDKTASGAISFRTSGINQQNYELTTLSLNYIAGIVKSQPDSTFVWDSSSKTTALFNISVDVVCSLLLITSLEGSTIPLNFSRNSLSANILSILPSQTQTQFSEATYNTPLQIQLVTITQLTSNISYQSSLYILSDSNTYLLEGTVHFWTASFDPVCEITFNFNNNLSTIERSSFLQTVSYTLSVPITILNDNPFQAIPTRMRIMIGQVQNNSQFPVPCLLSQNLYIRPERLQSRIQSLQLQNPYASQTGPITTIPLPQLSLSSYNIDYLTFSVELLTYGNIYSVLTYESDGLPSIQQVYLGLASGNILPIWSKVLTEVKGRNQISFKMLGAFKMYRVCIVVSNVDPLPNLGKEITCLEAKTQYPPGRVVLQITWGSKLGVVSVLFILMFIL